jgi:hypothetical protein
MKRIITQSRLWLAPTVLAAAALLACNHNPTTETQANTPQSASASSGQRVEWGHQHQELVDRPLRPGCTNPRSADDFLPGTRHVPKC